MKIKYPHTWHLPGSNPQSSDNRLDPQNVLEMFEGKQVIITEKMDGENTSIYRDHIHARSLDSCSHASRDWVHALWGSLRWKLPEGYRVCGENLYAKHAIYYPTLPSYFMVFSIWNGRWCLPWKDTMDLTKDWLLEPVPVLYEGVFSERILWEYCKQIDTGSLAGGISGNEGEAEGIVIRLADGIKFDSFGRSTAKYVRAGHVQEDEVHWFNKAIVTNGIIETKVGER